MIPCDAITTRVKDDKPHRCRNRARFTNGEHNFCLQHAKVDSDSAELRPGLYLIPGERHSQNR
jgi:hypothetical protein